MRLWFDEIIGANQGTIPRCQGRPPPCISPPARKTTGIFCHGMKSPGMTSCGKVKSRSRPCRSMGAPAGKKWKPASHARWRSARRKLEIARCWLKWLLENHPPDSARGFSPNLLGPAVPWKNPSSTMGHSWTIGIIKTRENHPERSRS